MDTKSEILKNASSLNEAQINYHQDRYTQIEKQKREAETILSQYDNTDDFIEQLNGMAEYKDRKSKDGETKRGLSQFLDSKQQRDLLVSVWILMKDGERDSKLLEKFKINLKEPEAFDKEVKEIIRRTRKVAKEKDEKSPSPEEVQQYFAEKGKKGQREEEEEIPSDEEEQDSEETPDSEEEVDTSFPPKDEDESDEEDEEGKSDEEDEEGDSDDEERPKKKRSVVDETKFPAPKDMAEKIEKSKEDALERLKNLVSKIENPSREQKASADRTEKRLRSSLDGLIKKAENLQRGYEVHATENSAMKASTNAKKAYNDAQERVNTIISKFERSQMPSFVDRQVKKAKEIGTGTKKAATSLSRTRGYKLTKDALSSAAQKSKEGIGRGTEKAKEGIGRVQKSVQEKKAINTIGNFLGKEARNKYIEAIQNDDEAVKNRIEKELEQARQKQKQEKEANEKSRQERIRQQRLEKMKESNQAIKSFLNEKEDTTIKPGKEFETVAKNLDPNSAKKYKELSTSSSIEDRKKAPELLAKAAEAKKQKEEELKDQEEKVKQEINKKPASSTMKNESRSSIIRKALKKPLYS